MAHIQRTLIRIDRERVVVQQNHYVGLAFAALAAVPILVPFKSSASTFGVVATTSGAVALLMIGTAIFLWRRRLVLDLVQHRCTMTSGFWPFVQATEAPLSRLVAVRVEESRRSKRRAAVYEVSFVLDGERDRVPLFETTTRDEALEVQQEWVRWLEPAHAPRAEFVELRRAA